jgi:hypothetical protein
METFVAGEMITDEYKNFQGLAFESTGDEEHRRAWVYRTFSNPGRSYASIA